MTPANVTERNSAAVNPCWVGFSDVWREERRMFLTGAQYVENPNASDPQK